MPDWEKGSGISLLCLAMLLPLVALSGLSFLASRNAPIELSIPNSNVKHSSSCIVISNNGELLLSVNPDSNTVSIIDTATKSLLAEVAVGTTPHSVVISPDNTRAYVTNKGSDNLSVVDLELKKNVKFLPLGRQPTGIVLSPDTAHLAIALMGEDQVLFLNPIDLSVRTSFTVPDRPYGLAYTPDGHRLLVSHLLSGDLSIITYPLFQSFLPFLLIPDLDGMVQPDSRYWRGRRYFTTTSITPSSLSISTWPNVAPAPSVLVNARGTRAYLPQTMANGLGLNTQFDTSVFPKVSVVNLTDFSHQPSEHISLPETDQPVGLPWDASLAKNDTELWVVNSASNDLSVIDISNPAIPRRVAHILVGDNPRGIVLSPYGNWAYVNNTLAGTVSVIDANTHKVTSVITVTNIPLPPALLHGKRLFFSSARSDLAQAAWISCNTCHVEGEHDGRTWLLQYLGSVPPGEQPIIRRNTTSLLGMVETYPLRWSAEWDESADSEFSVRFEQFGSGLIDGDMHLTLGPPNQGRSYDLDCLALFIDSLAVPAWNHTFNESELRGKTIFESPQTQCADCHPAPLYTDLQVHDVGTADGPGEWFGPLIDTPTLRFLNDSAPYLHDGNAATLLEVLTTANPADEHGITSQLSANQIDDLIYFLLVLPYE